MRQLVFLSILAFFLMQLNLAANTDNNQRGKLPPDDPRIMEFKQVPVSEEIRQKMVEKVMVSDGGNEYFCLLPANDYTASTGNLSIYICTGKQKNT
jgi:hypothetical protein